MAVLISTTTAQATILFFNNLDPKWIKYDINYHQWVAA